MRSRRGGHGRSGALFGTSSALLTAFMLTAVVGCGTRQGEQGQAGSQAAGSQAPGSQAAGSQSKVEPSAQATLVASVEAPAVQPRATQRAGSVHRITLSGRRCIRFEPQWTNVRMGQSLTWHSDLQTPITIYVSPGVFSKASFRIRPGGTVSTGPALATGRYSFWTEPAACRDAPRGVLLAGPGVRVQETFYASTGPR